MGNLRNYIINETMVFDDDQHPSTSPYDIVWPVSSIDAIIDQNTPDRITLRQILNQLTKRIDEGQEELELEYPVRSVRGERYADQPLHQDFLGDVIITKESLGLENVDNVEDRLKPISVPQKNWIENYVTQKINELPAPDMSTFTAHINNRSNPHGVTLNHINVGGRDGAVTDLIAAMIDTHDVSINSHNDIRSAMDRLTSIVNSNHVHITGDASKLRSIVTEHINVGGADHVALFASKEDKASKVGFFSSSYINAPGVTVTDLDDQHYPSTLAVANYIEARLVRPVNSSIGGGSSGGGGSSEIRNLTVRSDDKSLPPPSAANVGQAYLISELKDSPGWAGLVVSRKVGNQYQWVVDKYIEIAKMDPAYFEQGPSGWKFKPQVTTVDTLTDVILKMNYVADGNTGERYYTLAETLHGNRFAGGVETREIFKFGALASQSTVSGSDIVPASITNSSLQDKTITGNKLVDRTVGRDQIGYSAIGVDELDSGCLRAVHFPVSTTDPEGTPTTQMINNSLIQPTSINYTKLRDYNIPNTKLSQVPGQTLKGKLSLGTGKLEDIPIRSVAMTMAEIIGSMMRLTMVSSWPTSVESYPNGSVVYNGSINAIGVRVSNSAWRYISLSGYDNVTPTA